MIFNKPDVKYVVIASIVSLFVVFAACTYTIIDESQKELNYLYQNFKDGTKQGFDELHLFEGQKLVNDVCGSESIHYMQRELISVTSRTTPLLRSSVMPLNVYCSPFGEMVLSDYQPVNLKKEYLGEFGWKVGLIVDNNTQATKMFVVNDYHGFLYSFRGKYSHFSYSKGSITVRYADSGKEAFTIRKAKNDISVFKVEHLVKNEVFSIEQVITLSELIDAMIDKAFVLLLLTLVTSISICQYYRHKREINGIEYYKAIQNSEFIPAYQPIVDVCKQELIGVELLIRWRKPDGTIVMPNNFIEKMETNGSIIAATQLMIEKSIVDLADFRGKIDGFYCSVNITPQHLQSDDFIDFMSNGMAECSLFSLELTERQPIQDLKKACERLLRLKSLGLTISLDDAGTGYGGNSYLLELPIDTVKIDRMFVSTLRDGNDSKVIDSYISMCQSLGKKIIAEGVETDEESNQLSVRGVTLHQGYLYGKPLFIEDLNVWAKEWGCCK